MRSEKGITLVALIAVMALLIILAGVSITLAVKGGTEDQTSANELPENELVVNPYAVDTEDEEEVEDEENIAVEDTNTVDNTVSNTVENTVDTDEDSNTVDVDNTVVNEVE